MGLGTAVCPWSISVSPNQRINITMIDFAVAPNISETSNKLVTAKCIEYAAITERRTVDNGGSATWQLICGRRLRESVVYVSQSNYVEIQIRTDNLTEQFLLKYEGRFQKSALYLSAAKIFAEICICVHLVTVFAARPPILNFRMN